MRAVVTRLRDKPSLASVLPPRESRPLSGTAGSVSVMAGRWRKQMFERGKTGGALQRANEFVKVASREPIGAKGDRDRGSFEAREAR